MEEFYATVRVVLGTPVRSEGDVLLGYYINVGVTASDAREAKSLIEEAIHDGSVDWEATEWFDSNTLGPAISKFRIEAKCPIIWYKSPRILFPLSEEG